MGITIQEYRSRIGRFLPKSSYRNSRNDNPVIKNETLSLQKLYVIAAVIVLVPIMITSLED